MKQYSNLTRNMNQTDLNDLGQAQLKYNDLIQQYTAMQQKINNLSIIIHFGISCAISLRKQR